MKPPPFILRILALALLTVPWAPPRAADTAMPERLAVTQPAGPARSEQAQQFQELVNILADPAMEGRGPGTAGLDRARDFLVESFRQAGLGPAFRTPDPSFTQSLQMKLSVRAREQALALLDQHGRRLHDAAAGREFSALGFSSDGAFAAPAVFVGYGIVVPERKYDSYAAAGDAVRGKVAVAFRFEPQDDEGKGLWTRDKPGELGPWTRAADLTHKAKWAAERGAVALLVVDPPTQATPGAALRTAAQTAAAESVPIPVMHISTEMFELALRHAGRDPKAALRQFQKDADQGKTRLQPLEGVRLRGDVELERPMVTVANVAGVVPGAGALATEVVVVGAHYDHLGFGDIGSLDRESKGKIHHGADDNASGTAALVMLARHFAQVQPESNDRRTLLFTAFTGEERGLIGSRHFVKNLTSDTGLEARQIVAMVNLDMVGRMTEDRLYVLGTGSGDRWEKLAEDAGRRVGLKIRTDASPLGGSDHVSFFTEKVPAIHLFTGSHADYHRPSDTAEKINAEGGAAVVAFTTELVQRLAREQQRLAFRSEGADPHAGGLSPERGGGGAQLGVMPDYASLEGGEGCAIAGVLPGTAAEAAGLKTGDVIVQWDQQRIGNVHGLTARLRESKPGDTVKLRVKRGDETLDLDVKLGQR